MSQNLVVPTHPETSVTLLTPPPAGAPVPPPAAEALLVRVSSRRPTRKQRTGALEVTQELAAHPEEAARLFGGDVDVHRLVTAFTLASAWAGERARAEAWLAYCRDADATAWQGPLGLLAPVVTAALNRLEADEVSMARFPALAAFLGSRRESSKRAARGRRAKPKGGVAPKP